MDAPIKVDGIYHDFKPVFQAGVLSNGPPPFAVLHGTNEATIKSTDLFGKIEEFVNCLYCHKPIFKPRKNQKVHGECRTPYRKQREAAAKQAVSDAREQEAMAWIKEHSEVIEAIREQLHNHYFYHGEKIGFREFWEQARRCYRHITFDNNHSRFVSRYIMEHYPELAGAFRTRG